MLSRRGVRAVAIAVAIALAMPLPGSPAGAAACDPFTTPTYADRVPSPEEVLGFAIGSREVTSEEILTYLDAVDAASEEVVTGTAATSVQGRPIRYAIVGRDVTAAGLATLRANLTALRDPALPAEEAAAIAAATPRTLWLAGNVHGTEESGADASLQLLYDLADRTDCAADVIRDNAVVVIMPSQNRDGREMETRRNAYGFDLNRDWFARTQPETDGKIELLRRYPPMLFMDEHEFGYKDFLFPPHADPEYHLHPSARLVRPLGETPAPALPARVPSIGLFENRRSTRGYEAAGQFRWLAERRWHLPYTDVGTEDIRAGLPGIDVLVMPDGYARYALQDLGSRGKRALREWVAAGGRLVAWQGGAEVAARAGVSTVVLRTSHTNMPGSLVRVRLDPANPLSAGVGSSVWVMYDDDETMDPGLGAAAAWFPPDAAVNGLDEGFETLAGTAVVADERVGRGRVISFAVDPNFRGWTMGMQRVLWNALLGPDPVTAVGGAVRSQARLAAVREARSAARALPPVGAAPLRLGVAPRDAREAVRVIRDWNARAFALRIDGGVLLQVPNPGELSGEEGPFADLLARLSSAGVRVRWASLP